MQEALTFDDVIIQPGYSDISSRHNGEIDTSTLLCKDIEMGIPIVSANMDTITGGEMASAMSLLGGIGIIHRFSIFARQEQELKKVAPSRCVFSIGVGKEGQSRCRYLVEYEGGANPKAVCIDIAHGHCAAMFDQIRWVKRTYPGLKIIAGNVATARGALDLVEAGADAIKVGVGPGSLCSTRTVTGCGVPQFTAIKSISENLAHKNLTTPIIADGGVRNSGDIVKCLAIGASSVMLGSLLAGCNEAPGEPFSIPGDDKKYKRYAGMASEEAQMNWKGYISTVEGESTFVPAIGPVKDVIDRLMRGVRSGMSYVGARTIKELQEKAVFIRQTSAGYIESTAHRL